MPSTTTEETLLQQITDLRQEVTTLRMTMREMGRELRTVLSIHPLPTGEQLTRDERLWMYAVECAADCYSVTPGQVLSRERTDNVGAARQFAYWLCVKVAGWSYSHAGRITARNHVTISWGINQHMNSMRFRKAHGSTLIQDEAEARFRAYLKSPEYAGVKPQP